jgi:hypothetical protein
MRNAKVIRQCSSCKQVFEIRVDHADYELWQNTQTLIQEAMSYLSEDDRELLISGTCGKCFDRLFEGSNE